jgi:3-deoxy-7-phosphoheptulonate synthase
VVAIGDVLVGADEVIMMAGPCSAESEAQVEATAAAVKRAARRFSVAARSRPAVQPYSFQGLGEEGLVMLRAASDRHDLKLITEGHGEQPDRSG